uniref:Uncharacterized protein n=1 Tax=Firmicutes phage HS11 TaxID=3056393 RepID=A0AA49X8D7_9VIRU|nr:MAG: hypothetical protein [Firmicutes phage HS11]
MIVAIIVIISIISSPPFCIYYSAYAIYCQHFSIDLIPIKCAYFNVSSDVRTISHAIFCTKKPPRLRSGPANWAYLHYA